MRVTGGRLRSRQLVCPRGTRTRPTSDRVREALFSILHHEGEVRGARVLDLYAGTGALAIEALSRGADHAVLVESDRAALAALRRNLQALDLAAMTSIVADDVARAAGAPRGRAQHGALAALAGEGFSLVLCDPPYDDVPLASRILAELAPLFAEGARIALEHASRDPGPDVAGLSREDTRTWGDTAVSFYGHARD